MEKTYSEKKEETFREFQTIISNMTKVELYSYLYDIAKTMRLDEIEELIYKSKYSR